MSKLSALKATPVWYDVTIPSTGVKTKFKSYTIGDEKSLLIAQESEDSDTMVSTLHAVIQNCLREPQEPLTVYDLEYLYTKLRSKSVGEISNLVMTCNTPKCAEEEVKTKVPVNLETVYIDRPEGQKPFLVVKITPTRGMKITHPSVSEAMIIDSIEREVDRDLISLSLCIREVYDGDEVLDMSGETQADRMSFVVDLPVSVKDEAIEFLDNMPTTAIDVKFKCLGCRKDHSITLKGMSNFF
mgnify:CR=1 FL=1